MTELTETIRDVDQLEELLSRPSDRVIETMARLDGDLIVLGAEGVSRRSMTLRQRIVVQQIGFVFLIALMVLVTLLDVSRFVTR